MVLLSRGTTDSDSLHMRANIIKNVNVKLSTHTVLRGAVDNIFNSKVLIKMN